jgi:acyl-CoA thioesterase
VRIGADAAPTVRWSGAEWPTPAELAAGRPYEITVDPLLCAAGGLIFGGWTMALITEAVQAWTGGRLRSLTTNFLAPIVVGDRLVLEPTVLRQGRRVRQLAVTARVQGKAVVTATAVIGGPAAPGPGVTPPPDVPAPEECPQRSYRFRKPGSLIDVMDVRLASPEPDAVARPARSVLLWARLDADVSDAGRLVVLSDHLPYLVVRALPAVRHATTVSASVRLAAGTATEWTLLEPVLLAVDAEFCIGMVRLWSETGALLATAEQTTYLVPTG